MNTKKILLSTLVAATLGLGIAMPISSATTVDGSKTVANFQTDYLNNKKSITIMLQNLSEEQQVSGVPTLSTTDFESLVGKKFEGKTVEYNYSSQNGNAGTGTVVTVDTDNEFTTILYGDVDGNGIVNSFDVRALAKAIASGEVENNTLSDEVVKAANLRYTDDNKVSSFDVRRIATLVMGAWTDNEYSQIDFPDDTEFMTLDSAIKDSVDSLATEVGGEDDYLTSLTFDESDNTIKVEVNNEKLSDNVSLAELLNDENNNDVKNTLKSIRDTLKETASSNIIRVTYGEGTAHEIDITDSSLKGLQQNQEFKSLIREILGEEYKDKTADQLMATPLKDLIAAIEANLNVEVQSGALLDDTSAWEKYIIDIQ